MIDPPLPARFQRSSAQSGCLEIPTTSITMGNATPLRCSMPRALVAFAAFVISFGATAQERSVDRDVDALLSGIVHVRMKALAAARSNANLGGDREGTGVVIDGDGHIVTIGYLVVEA